MNHVQGNLYTMGPTKSGRFSNIIKLSVHMMKVSLTCSTVHTVYACTHVHM